MPTRVKRRVLARFGDVMTYLVLAVGALMWLAGLYAIVTGYPIIQIERGWATVIAGSTLFTGGLVTMAIGLVLRALIRIEIALEMRPTAAAYTPTALGTATVLGTPTALGTEDTFEPVERPEPARRNPLRPEIAPFAAERDPVFAAPEFAAPVFPPPRDDRDINERRGIEDRHLAAFEQETFGRAGEAPWETPAADHLHDAEPAYEPDHLDHYELQTPSTPEHNLPEHALPAHDLAGHDAHDHESAAHDHAEDTVPRHDQTERELAEQDSREHDIPQHDLTEAELYQHDLPEQTPPEHDMAPPIEMPPAKVEPVSQDDWLDHAFSSLDQELALGPATRHPNPAVHDTVADSPVAEAEHEPYHQHDDEAALQAHPSESEPRGVQPAADWAPPAPDIAVIGRYESDGTSYIMYADGSIEAQSEAGIYRFRSMAELKAFIEG